MKSSQYPALPQPRGSVPYASPVKIDAVDHSVNEWSTTSKMYTPSRMIGEFPSVS